jgi:DNA-binding CsgD family transcriptional regulator
LNPSSKKPAMNIGSLSRIFDSQILFELIRPYWIKYHQKELGVFETPFKVDITTLDHLSVGTHTFYVIFDHATMKLLYVAKNAELIVGYTTADIMEKGFSIIFKMMPIAQIPFFIHLLKWHKLVSAKYLISGEPFDLSYTFCGLKLTAKNGREMKTLMRVIPIEKTETGQLIKSIIVCTDITSMMKTNKYWVLFKIKQTIERNIAFFSDQLDGNGIDLISPRELEVLNLVALGKSSKEIGESLFISQFTVEKHRKNMILRTGVQDSLALVDICRQSGII